MVSLHQLLLAETGFMTQIFFWHYSTAEPLFEEHPKILKKNQCGVVLEEVQLTVLDLHAWKFQVDFFFLQKKWS